MSPTVGLHKQIYKFQNENYQQMLTNNQTNANIRFGK